MDMRNQIKLKDSSILNVPLFKFDKDFTFIVNDQAYKTSRIIADLLSPKICQIHMTDPTIDSFTINTKEPGDFSHIINLVNFNTNYIPDKDFQFFSEVVESLSIENIEIKLPEETTFTIEYAIKVLQNDKINKNNKFCILKRQKAIEFLASSIYKIESYDEIDELLTLSPDTLETVFSHSKIQLKSEDQLLTIFNRLYQTDPSLSFLYEFVNFTNLSIESISSFIEIFDESDMSRQLWIEISKRLQQEIKEKKDDDFDESRIAKEFRIIKSLNVEYKGEPFSGIIHSLTTKYSGNVNDKGIIDISGNRDVTISDTFYGSFSSLVDFNYSKNCYKSENKPNSFIQFDFKNHKISVSAYSIKSSNLPGPSLLKSWVIEGSDDSNSWTVIDSHTNDQSLCVESFEPKVCTFNVNNNGSENKFRFIRLRITGKTSNDNWCIGITNIEFFGKYF